jgi:hypothetical protein
MNEMTRTRVLNSLRAFGSLILAALCAVAPTITLASAVAPSSTVNGSPVQVFVVAPAHAQTATSIPYSGINPSAGTTSPPTSARTTVLNTSQLFPPELMSSAAGFDTGVALVPTEKVAHRPMQVARERGLNEGSKKDASLPDANINGYQP